MPATTLCAGIRQPPAPALAEVEQVAREINDMADVGTATAQVALVFDYESAWAWEVQPQGRDFDIFRLVVATYRALRRAGLSKDILPADTADLGQYKLVLAPGLMTLSAPLRAGLASCNGIALIGPRTGMKTTDLSIPLPLGPNVLGLDVSVVLTESLPRIADVPLAGGGRFLHWFEHLEGSAPVLRHTADGKPAIMGMQHLRYLPGWPDDETFYIIVCDLCAETGLPALDRPEGLRIRDTATHHFVLNYAADAQDLNGTTIPAAGVHWEGLA